MSLFITDLAFTEPRLADEARIGILVASVLASALGFMVFRAWPRTDRPPEDAGRGP